MQDYTKMPDGKRKHRVYSRPPAFNYGFIPRTWSDPRTGGDGDAIDLVDLTEVKKGVLAVSNYTVLGILGLVD